MNTQISFTADQELKEKAADKAKRKGITLKSLFVFSMEAFVNDKIDLGLISKNDDVEEMHFEDDNINANAKKLADLLS